MSNSGLSFCFEHGLGRDIAIVLIKDFWPGGFLDGLLVSAA